MKAHVALLYCCIVVRTLYAKEHYLYWSLNINNLRKSINISTYI